MAASESIPAAYSPKLDTMAQWVGDFLRTEQDPLTRLRAFKGIEDFCYKNTPAFVDSFLAEAGVPEIEETEWAPLSPDVQQSFVDKLCSLDGECVFLLKDTYDVMRQYQGKTNKGYGLTINRKFLCKDGNEEDYFTLIEPIYDTLSEATTMEGFLEGYQQRFEALLEQNEHFSARAQQIHDYIAERSTERVIWTDLGFQFTFVLFCYAAVKHFSKGTIPQDFYCFTTYPWLQDSLFKGQYFSEHSEAVLDWELESIRQYLGHAAANPEVDHLAEFAARPR